MLPTNTIMTSQNTHFLGINIIIKTIKLLVSLTFQLDELAELAGIESVADLDFFSKKINNLGLSLRTKTYTDIYNYFKICIKDQT